MIVVGVDPDSEAHGVAVYADGELTALASMTLMDIQAWIKSRDEDDHPVMFSIENVLAQSFVYARNSQQTKSAQAKVGVGIGRCQQAQQELMRMLDHYQVPYVLHKPSGMNWAKDRARFERTTGWHGKSNEDTRSGAYWGWLAVQGMMK